MVASLLRISFSKLVAFGEHRWVLIFFNYVAAVGMWYPNTLDSFAHHGVSRCLTAKVRKLPLLIGSCDWSKAAYRMYVVS